MTGFRSLRRLCSIVRHALSSLVFLAGLAVSLNAATWYVDGTASGANSGTSWADAWTTLTAVKGIGPGDTVYISGGPSGSSQTYTLASSWSLKSGAAGNPITYQIGQDAGHNGTAIFSTSAGGPWINAAVTAAGSLHDVIVSGDAGDGLRHFRLANYRSVFYVNNGSFHLLNWYIGYVDFGNLSTCGSLLNVNKVELAYCKWNIDDLNGNGSLSIDFKGSTWGENSIHHCEASAPNDGYGMGVDFIQGGTSGVSVHHNTFTGYATAYTGTQHQDGWQPLTGSYLEVYGNRFINIVNYSVFFEAYYGGFSHVRIYNNIITGTLPSIQTSTAPRGIMVVPGGGAFRNLGYWPAFDDIVIANNVICDLGGTHAAVQLQNQNATQFSIFTNCYAYNNIGINGGAFNFDPAVGQGNNLRFTSAEAENVFSSYANMSPINDLRPAPLATALIGQGVDLSAYFAVDQAGAARPSGINWDIGAFQHDTAALAPTLSLQPANQTVAAGTTVTLTAAAAGSPAPTYQWLKNGAAISGATSATLTLSAVTAAHQGSYAVLVTNSAGSVTSDSAVLTVNTGPVITTAPQSQTVLSGTTLILTAVASGDPAPSYQWSRNGITLPGANASTLVLSAVTLTDAATYAVTATNTAGSVTSAGAVLTVTVPPVITTSPVAQTVETGATVTFSVAASGFPTPVLQWSKNGTPLSGALASSLTLKTVSANDAGTYSVTATNTAGTATGSAVLTVHAPVVTPPDDPTKTPSDTDSGSGTPSAQAPVFASGPVGQSVVADATVTFSAVASGDPAPSYQWTRNGIILPGETSATLVLASVTLEDAAIYAVTATNAAGSVTSADAVLTVSVPPVITTPPASQTVETGTTVTFSVAASGFPTPAYQWLKNDRPLSGATTDHLTLDAVTATDAGTYTVTATNDAGSVTAGAVLAVHAPVVTPTPDDSDTGTPLNQAPIFTLEPVGQSVIAGATVTFSAAASGVPTPTYQWRRNTTFLPGQTGPTLTLAGVTSFNSGTYTVVATNVLGTTTSAGAVLTVTTRATITKQPLSQTVAIGGTVTLTAAGSGSPAPTYQWMKNGIALPGATSATLTLTGLGPTDGGAYAVVMTNAAGSVTSNNAVLTVVTPGHFANLSVRAQPGSGGDALIIGFVAADAPRKPVLVRAVGPGMAEFSSLAAFDDPQLTLYSGSTPIDANDNWGGSDTLQAAFNRLGAFALPAASRDAALLTTLTPGGYTAIVSGTGQGVVLAEIYDADEAANTAGRLVNLSARARVGTGDGVVIAGFVIGGDTPMQVLIRAVGPSLAAKGVTGVLIDPQLDLYRGSTRLQHNDNWGGDAALLTAFSQTGAFALENAGSKDAAILVTLDPGAYTAIVSGVSGTTGNVLVEAYEVR